ncbi:MAG: hypothetical protein NTW61_03255 [Candidatus Melainabacteria bacterium]|nr:hypothetical protein [Candidatus Melainabacteria bacterium]
MPQQRDYFEQSLFRRLGVEGLVFYLKETKHQLLKAIQTLVDKSTTKASRKELPELIRHQLMEAGNNPHLETDKKAFEESAMADFKTFENAGKHIKAEAYNSEERLLIHIWYQGSLKTVEEFTDKAEIEPRKLHPPIETALVYYYATGLLKVKTHRNKESLAKALSV